MTKHPVDVSWEEWQAKVRRIRDTNQKNEPPQPAEEPRADDHHMKLYKVEHTLPDGTVIRFPDVLRHKYLHEIIGSKNKTPMQFVVKDLEESLRRAKAKRRIRKVRKALSKIALGKRKGKDHVNLNPTTANTTYDDIRGTTPAQISVRGKTDV